MRMRTIHNRDHGADVRRLQNQINLRLKHRSAGNHQVKVDGVFGIATRAALVKACYLMGMSQGQLGDHVRMGGISPEVQRFVFNPGKRTREQKHSGADRVRKLRAVLKRQRQERQSAAHKRQRICEEAEKAAANYRRNPWAYHYLAGGVANTVYLNPTPRNWRSDCSQFAAAVYKGAGLPSPARPLEHAWASTYSIVKAQGHRIVDRAHRRPGDLGMYGSREAPHHVEIWCGTHFIGHGSPPIDSLTPGEPNYYVTFDFLD